MNLNMKTISKLISKKRYSIVLRYALLFALSRVLVNLKFINFLKSVLFDKNNVKNLTPTRAPLAKSTSNWLLFAIFGHLADIKPWANTKFGELPLKLLNQRKLWYKSVSGNNCETVRVNIANETFVFTKSLDLISALHGKEDALLRNSDTFRKSWGRLFPSSVVVLRDDSWKKVRRVLVSAISNLDFQKLPSSTNEVLVESLDKCLAHDTQEVNLWDFFSRVTFDSFHKFAYNINFKTMSGENEKILSTLRELTRKISDRIIVPLDILWYLPLQTNKDLFRLRNELENFMDERIRERTNFLQKNQSSFKDKKCCNLLDALIFATLKENIKGQKLSHVEIRSQLIAAVFGGFDTTTSSLSFLMKMLCENSEYQEKLFEEVKNVDLTLATKKYLDQLKYLNSILKETQRLQAVVPVVVRVPNRDVVINGVYMKEATSIFTDQEALGQDSRYWDGATDLKNFRPERWFNFKPEKGVFSPFGFGGRKCPGHKIAETQMQTILSHLCQKYIFKLSKKPIEIACSLGVTVTSDSTFIMNKRE